MALDRGGPVLAKHILETSCRTRSASVLLGKSIVPESTCLPSRRVRETVSVVAGKTSESEHLTNRKPRQPNQQYYRSIRIVIDIDSKVDSEDNGQVKCGIKNCMEDSRHFQPPRALTLPLAPRLCHPPQLQNRFFRHTSFLPTYIYLSSQHPSDSRTITAHTHSKTHLPSTRLQLHTSASINMQIFVKTRKLTPH